MPKKKNERQRVKEVLYTMGTTYEKLEDVMKIFQDCLAKAPEGVEVRFDIDAYDNWDSPSAKLEIYYYRDENDVEMSARLTREQEWKDREIANAKRVLGIK
jgi:hypothetical protein